MAKIHYYVVDTTKSVNGQNPCMIFETIEGLISYLEGMCLRATKKTRLNFMSSAADTGLTEDDGRGRAFYELMTEYFNIGFIKNNYPSRKNIFEAEYTEKYREEHGD